MLIRVEQRHIDNGVRGNCRECMVALALRDLLPRVWYVSVDCDLITIGGRSYDMPEGVHSRVAAFDEGRPVAPFSFELPIAEGGAP